jgi:hypothetical protein
LIGSLQRAVLILRSRTGRIQDTTAMGTGNLVSKKAKGDSKSTAAGGALMAEAGNSPMDRFAA